VPPVLANCVLRAAVRFELLQKALQCLFEFQRGLLGVLAWISRPVTWGLWGRISASGINGEPERNFHRAKFPAVPTPNRHSCARPCRFRLRIGRPWFPLPLEIAPKFPSRTGPNRPACARQWRFRTRSWLPESPKSGTIWEPGRNMPGLACFR
jgi:hypothetical protein